MTAEDLRAAFGSVGPIEMRIDGYRMLLKLRDGTEITATGSCGLPAVAIGTIVSVWNELPTVADAVQEPDLTDPGKKTAPGQKKKE